MYRAENSSSTIHHWWCFGNWWKILQQMAPMVATHVENQKYTIKTKFFANFPTFYEHVYWARFSEFLNEFNYRFKQINCRI